MQNLNNSKSEHKILTSQTIVVVLLICVCLVFISNPAKYSASCLNAISVWGLKVLPCLFPFFIFTKIIIGLIPPKQSKLDKLFFKVYHTPATSSSVYLLSLLSGYPMGAKMVADLFEKGVYTRQDAKRMLSFCSVSGPMFMVGTVGVAIFGSFKAGIIILIANILASIFNGLIFRGKKQKNGESVIVESKNSNSILTDSVYDALISILLVGAYMTLAFLMIDLICSARFLTKPLELMGENGNILKAILCGGIEITRGMIELNNCLLPLKIKLIAASGLIGFGGICVIMQSFAFLKKLDIKFGFVILQKLVQGVLAAVFASLIVLLV